LQKKIQKVQNYIFFLKYIGKNIIKTHFTFFVKKKTKIKLEQTKCFCLIIVFLHAFDGEIFGAKTQDFWQ